MQRLASKLSNIGEPENVWPMPAKPCHGIRIYLDLGRTFKASGFKAKIHPPNSGE
jgi:hypothetical protein